MGGVLFFINMAVGCCTLLRMDLPIYAAHLTHGLPRPRCSSGVSHHHASRCFEASQGRCEEVECARTGGRLATGSSEYGRYIICSWTIGEKDIIDSIIV